jgi:hypothetical protein
VINHLRTWPSRVNLGYLFNYSYDSAGKSDMCDATAFDTSRKIKGTCFNGVIDPITGDLLPHVVAALMNHSPEARARRRVSEFGAFTRKEPRPGRPNRSDLFLRLACPSQAVENQELAANLVSCRKAAPESRSMFTKAGIAEFHGAMHERLDLLLGHVATVPDSLLRSTMVAFQVLKRCGFAFRV